MNSVTPSPWWYRRRALVIGAIYLLGFWPIASYEGAHGIRYVSAAQALGAVAAVVVLTFACWVLRVWGSSYLTSSTVWSADSRNGALVTAGPFAYTRNPLYLGNVLMALGLGALAPPLGWAFINIANMVFVVMLIRWEEQGMRARYGEQFDAYCARVPRLLPRLSPAGPGNGTPILIEGLRAEIFTAALLIGTIAVVTSPAYGWLVFLLCYVFGITTQTVLARKRATA